MRQVLGILSSAITITAATYLVFRTQIGAHIGSMLGTGLFSLAQIESSVLQIVGIRTVSLTSIMHGDCVVLTAVAAWHIASGFRDFNDIPYKAILNGCLGMLGASSIWILNQVS